LTELKLPSDFSKLIAKTLGISESRIENLFDLSENKEGWFIARKLPKVWLETDQFKAMCNLAREYGGDYNKAEQTWRVPGPYIKKQEETAPTSMLLPGGESIPIVKQEPTATTRTPVPEDEHFQFIAIDEILNMPFQSRIAYEDPEINELVETIKQHGVLEPILVRPKNDRFEVVAGHRRLRAAKQAQLTSIPAVVKPLSDQEAFEIHFIENLQRKDLTDTEKGRMLSEMIKRYPEAYPTHEVLAFKIGKSREWVSRLIRMAETIEQDTNVKRLTMLKPDTSVEEVSALMRVEPLKRGEAVDQIQREIESGHVPSVRETKAILEPVVERRIAEQPQAPESAPSEPKPEPVDVAEFTGKKIEEEALKPKKCPLELFFQEEIQKKLAVKRDDELRCENCVLQGSCKETMQQLERFAQSIVEAKV